MNINYYEGHEEGIIMTLNSCHHNIAAPILHKNNSTQLEHIERKVG